MKRSQRRFSSGKFASKTKSHTDSSCLIVLSLPACVFALWQEADGDDRVGLQGDAEGDCDSKADTPDVPPSTADTDNTPQCLNKALEGLPPRYQLLC